VILYRDEDFAAKVKEITGGKMCEVRAEGAPRSRKPRHNGIEHSAAVIGSAPRSWRAQPINLAIRAKAAWSLAPGASRRIPTTSIASAKRSTVATVSSSDAALFSLC
jgi:hypothetical protein